jgi:hypothetical protein
MVRKKKTVTDDTLAAYNDERLVSTFDKKALQETWPKVVKGSHLTVTTYESGQTKLEWDDDALMRDVQNALTEYENSVKVNATPTKSKRKKKNET